MQNYKLRDLMKFCYGKEQRKVENPNGKYKIFGSSGCISYSDRYLYDKPSVLIGRKGTINNPMYVNEPFWCIDTMFYSIINNDIVNPHYLYYLFCTINFSKLNESTGVPSLRVPTLENIKVSIPTLDSHN